MYFYQSESNRDGMKPIQKIITVVILLCSLSTVFAQSGYEDPYGANSNNGATGYGRRKNMPLRDISKLPKKEQEKIHEETAAKTIARLKTELNLDELQLIMVTKIIHETQKKQNNIAASDYAEEDKITETETLLASTDREIMSFLNKGQKEKLNFLIKERNIKFETLKDLRARN